MAGEAASPELVHHRLYGHAAGEAEVFFLNMDVGWEMILLG
jgi:hypothetical protein